MKAFLLAAGKGTRLRPLTNDVPKCLLPINGDPLLDIWLRNIEAAGIEEVLINLHYIPEKVEEHVNGYRGNLKIRLSFEEHLLGSAGTVRKNEGFVSGEESFFVLYADNLTDMDLKRMLDYHTNTAAVFTMGVFRTDKPHQCGVVEIGDDGTVVGFAEKPAFPKSNLANAGVYVASREIFRLIDDREPCDFGFDVIPRLVGSAKAYVIKDFIMDIGNLDSYDLAQKLWRKK